MPATARRKVVAYEQLGGLVSLPCIVEKIKQLMVGLARADTARR